jgi:Uma2 family endonuclease
MTVSLEDDKQWTYEDYCEIPEDGNRYEVIHGRLYMTPSPRTFHQTVSRRLQYVLYQLELQGKGYVFNAPMDLVMSGATPVEPDLIYLASGQRDLIEEKFIRGVPHLLVEILSPSTASRDRTLKLNLYAQAGVPHYWIVDPEARTFEVFHLVEGVYQVRAALAEDGSYRASEVEDVVVDLKEIFAGY